MPQAAAPMGLATPSRQAPGDSGRARDALQRDELLREAEAQRALAELFPHLQQGALRAIQELFPLARRVGEAANEAHATH